MPRAKAWCTAELEVEDQRLIPWGSRSCGVEWRERRGRRARMRALVVAAVAVARLGGWDLPPDARGSSGRTPACARGGGGGGGARAAAWRRGAAAGGILHEVP
jgi:hypothetical protein